jgi:hypothetical protein
MTLATRRVLTALADADELYGMQVCEMAGLPSGIVYPILARLEASRMAVLRQEDRDPARLGRPVRRYWRLAPGQAGRLVGELRAERTGWPRSSPSSTGGSPRTRRRMRNAGAELSRCPARDAERPGADRVITGACKSDNGSVRYRQRPARRGAPPRCLTSSRALAGR